MAYRSGTYVAFHAGGTINPILSDMRYYRMLLAWHGNDDCAFRITDSHEKAGVRDSSSRETLRAVLSERLRNSKNMVLILTDNTRWDTDWVPFEIEYAIDRCEIPIIAAYPGHEVIRNPNALSSLWPLALSSRIYSGLAHVLHVPFKQEPVKDAIGQFTYANYPLGGGLGIYSDEAYRSFGISG